MTAANLALRFALELCALAALAYWGWHTGDPRWLGVPLAVGAPLAAAVVWGRWVAPRARHRLADPLRLVPEFAVWVAAAAALWAAGRPVLAGALLVLAAANRAVLVALGARA